MCTNWADIFDVVLPSDSQRACIRCIGPHMVSIIVFTRTEVALMRRISDLVPLFEYRTEWLIGL